MHWLLLFGEIVCVLIGALVILFLAAETLLITLEILVRKDASLERDKQAAASPEETDRIMTALRLQRRQS